MNHITIVDVGTHRAEELKVLLSFHPYIINSYFKWIFDFFLRLVRFLLPPFNYRVYGRGPYYKPPVSFPIKFHLKCIFNTLSIKSRFFNTTQFICIDPQVSITSKSLSFSKGPIKFNYFPIALLNHKSTIDFGLHSFNVCHDTLSSSLDSDPTKIRSNEFCACFSTSIFLDQLFKVGFLTPKSTIVLRLNCEGSELAVLQAFIDKGLTPEVVLGSINDVFKKYGADDANKLNQLLSDYHIPFYYFKGSDPSTWQATIEFMSGFFPSH